jgi:glycerol-3-phosphate acyltransferase PlsY
MMTALLLLACAYGVGSLSFGLWLAGTQGVDLRATGSRNVGATNVLRTVGRLFAAVVLVLDAAKGAVAVVVARIVTNEPWLVVGCAVAAVAGHVWPIWAGFRGGKGVATLAGAYGALVPVAVMWSGVLFVCVVAMTRYISLASIVAVAALPIGTLLLDGRPSTTLGAFGLAALVVWRHGANIARLIDGSESRVSRSIVTGRRRGPFVA